MKIRLSRHAVLWFTPSYTDYYDTMYGDSLEVIIPAEETLIRKGKEVSRRSLSDAEKRKYRRFWKSQLGDTMRVKMIKAIHILYKKK